VSPRAVLDAVMKRKIPSPSRESNPRTPIVQAVAQGYTVIKYSTSMERGFGDLIRDYFKSLMIFQFS
jgi:hypothetical protein